ncbi:MAG: acyl-CoA thioesterase [Candidatus Neomarinimicrobiota bacterium]|nr:MAG: acyl-CoA thioesterase [Candidatus Neomarinimicrobiota bacterium]
MPDSSQPHGELTIQVVAMPRDTNPNGDIFGGWLLSQMDIAGGVFCRKIAQGRVVTVAMDSITFKHPVFVGDTLACYASLIRIGRTSITVHIEAWASRIYEADRRIMVTEGDITYVKIGEDRRPQVIDRGG